MRGFYGPQLIAGHFVNICGDFMARVIGAVQNISNERAQIKLFSLIGTTRRFTLSLS
jgi:hypothetical protein